MADETTKNATLNHILAKISSGRWISTVLILSTYCFILISGSVCCIILARSGKFDMTEKLFVYIIGNLTGTALGTLLAYHFKKGGTNETL